MEDLDSDAVSTARPHAGVLHRPVRLRTDSPKRPPSLGLARLFDFTLEVGPDRVADLLEPGVVRSQVTHLWSGRSELVRGASESRTADWLEAERADLADDGVGSTRGRASIEHSWQLARALWRFCYIRGYFEDIILTHRHALEAAEAAGDIDAMALMNNYLGLRLRPNR